MSLRLSTHFLSSAVPRKVLKNQGTIADSRVWKVAFCELEEAVSQFARKIALVSGPAASERQRTD
jgi:hypothetical protein